MFNIKKEVIDCSKKSQYGPNSRVNKKDYKMNRDAISTRKLSPRKSTDWYTRMNRNRPCICWTKQCQSTTIQTFVAHQRIGGATSTSLQPAMRLAWLDWRGNGDQAGEEGAMLIENVRHRSRGGRCQVNRCHGGLWTPGDGQDMRWGSGRCRKGRAQSINQEEHICSMIFLRQRNNWVLDLNFKKKLLF